MNEATMTTRRGTGHLIERRRFATWSKALAAGMAELERFRTGNGRRRAIQISIQQPITDDTGKVTGVNVMSFYESK